MSEDQIRYDVLVQDALRGVVRKVLGEVARTGLPGDHHFYISFDTQAPGVRISSRLRERHPDEMTIVIQHQYWDLQVTEHAFEVGLSFKGVPERLLIPFTAIKGMFDPSVQFGLEFEVAREDEEDTEADEAEESAAPVSEIGAAAKPEIGAAAKPAIEAAPTDAAPAGDAKGASVVSLDKFRKKT
jgi:hypothetical protein